MKSLKADIIIISYNTRELTDNCIKSIIKDNENSINRIIVVDNASKDDTVNYIKTNYPSVLLVRNSDNLGYAKAVNIGIKYTESEIVIISNSDVVYPRDSIKTMLEFFYKSQEIGCTAPQQIFADGSWQRSYGFYPSVKLALMDFFLLTSLNNAFKKTFWKFLPIDRHPKYVEYLDGACLFIRKKAFEQLGGFDEDYFFYTEEADYCYRMNRTQWQVIFYPKVKIIHHRGASYQNNNPKIIKMLIESKILFCKKHYPRFHTNLFIKIEKYHSIVMKYLWRLLSLLLRGDIKLKANSKHEFFSICSNIWRNNEKI